MGSSLLPLDLYSVSSLSTPSQRFFFLKFDSQAVSYKSIRAQRIQIICSNEAAHLEEMCQSSSLEKKQRKLKPSFLEQVQKKWSLRVPSMRENFPWQQQESGDTNHVPTQSAVIPADVLAETKNVSSFVGEKTESYAVSKSTLAPWAHGNGVNTNSLNPDSCGIGELEVQPKQWDIDRALEQSSSEVPLVEGLEEVAGSEEKVKLVQTSSLWFPDKDEILTIEDCEDISISVCSSSVSGEDNKISYATSNGNNSNKLPWERRSAEHLITGEKPRNRNSKLAERSIPEPDLNRLRNVSLRMVERINVGVAGVTQALVDSIQDKWRHQELVKLKFEGPLSENMKTAHELLERRTGGVVIWRSGSLVVLYRGITYNLDCVKSYRKQAEGDAGALGSSHDYSSDAIPVHQVSEAAEPSGLRNSRNLNKPSRQELVDLTEINLLLDELGPRFTDWQGREPIPVDADLLPAIVRGYETPFRLLPYATRQTLRDSEMTFLRRTARTLPPHFVLGRNRGLQGLAAAMVKLWEKSAIAVIAIKRGVLNTHNERMAEELKILTGGTLLSRNKEFIIFYRGNDFLPPGVSNALTEAERVAALRQDAEEKARNTASSVIDYRTYASEQPLLAGTLAETLAATSQWGSNVNSVEVEKMLKDSAVARRSSNLNSLQKKLALAQEKIWKSEKTLKKVLTNQEPEDIPTDLETLTDEERAVLRRIGLSMKPYLLLGRREIFDGTIENIHLHWKYREVVKIIVKWKTFAQVQHIAISLEAESGGLLVSVDKTPKGHAIILYRGKNYQPPLTFRPKKLLTGRQAFARSIELQRREGLRHHILELEGKFEKLEQELEDMTGVKEDESIERR